MSLSTDTVIAEPYQFTQGTAPLLSAFPTPERT